MKKKAIEGIPLAELNDHFVKMDLANLILTHFESNRRLTRVTEAILLAAQSGTLFPEAYRNVLIQEKEQLLNLLQRQLKKLNELRTPAAILRHKTQEINIVQAAINRLKKIKATRVAADLDRDLKKSVADDALRLSCGFVDSTILYNYLEGKNPPKGRAQEGLAKIKRLMAH
jgi:hypothetical protein